MTDLKEFMKKAGRLANNFGGLIMKPIQKARLFYWETVGADLGEGVKIKSGVELGPKVSIGDYSVISPNCKFRDKVSVGKFCAIAREGVFWGINHKISKAGMQRRFYGEILDYDLGSMKKGGIEIGNDVWTGIGVKILPGVKVGSGSVIGAGAVVTKDVDPYEVVGGNPAEHLKWRFPEKIREQLLELEWWNKPLKEIKKNRGFFQMNLKEFSSSDQETLLDYWLE